MAFNLKCSFNAPFCTAVGLWLCAPAVCGVCEEQQNHSCPLSPFGRELPYSCRLQGGGCESVCNGALEAQ